jgi:hypothetical protein
VRRSFYSTFHFVASHVCSPFSWCLLRRVICLAGFKLFSFCYARLSCDFLSIPPLYIERTPKPSHSPTLLLTLSLKTKIKNTHAVAWVALESRNPKLQRYLAMQCIKESSTLRVSSKREKPSPRVVLHFGRQSGEIKNFLKMRRLGNRICESSAHSGRAGLVLLFDN